MYSSLWSTDRVESPILVVRLSRVWLGTTAILDGSTFPTNAISFSYLCAFAQVVPALGILFLLFSKYGNHNVLMGLLSLLLHYNCP